MCNPGDVIINNDVPQIELNKNAEPPIIIGGTYNEVQNGNVCSLESTDSNIEHDEDPKSTLRKLKNNNVDRPLIAHLNIIFLGSKFEGLKSLIKDDIDILMISETKLDDTFPPGQFLIEGYSKPIRLDRNCHGGGILF